MIGLFGGTFDPIHLGHLGLANVASRQLDLQRVIFIPLGLPAHRELPQVSSQSRVNMLRAAVADHPEFEVSTVEIDRTTPSWTVHTLEHFSATYPEETLCLLMGSDAFGGINQWYRWQALLDYCHLVVISRSGVVLSDDAEVARYLADNRMHTIDELAERQHGGIYWLEADIADISSTGVREAIQAGAPLSGLLPPAVENLIRENEYYGYQ
jgi:nicotinate-nucleotide adenylyltransferase